MKNLTFLVFVVAILTASLQSLAQEASEASLIEHAWPVKEIETLQGDVWPQFRGLHGNGIAADNVQPPVEWGEDKNLLWKAELPGRAWSSPIVWKNRVWVTDADEDGKEQRLTGIDLDTGNIVYNQVLFRNETVQPDYHITNSYASPTPVTDGRYVYCHFGAYGTAAIDPNLSGEKSVVWQRRDLPCNHYRGAGSSPILFQNMLLMHFDGFDYQYVVALDKSTGETIWKANRDIDFKTDNGDLHKSFATPTVINVDGQLQLISPAAKAVESYDPKSGNRLWFVSYEEHSNASRPLFDGQLVYLLTGFSKGKLLAVDPRGKGDISDSNVKWVASKTIGCKPSPILHRGKIYDVEDRGVLSCLDAATGDTLWQKRLGGDFSSSPILANDILYAFDETGKGYTISTIEEGKILTENQLSAGCMASPAVVNDMLIVRTTAAVYCFRSKR